MTPGRNQTQATLVGGERSHRCAIPASLGLEYFISDWLRDP